MGIILHFITTNDLTAINQTDNLKFYISTHEFDDVQQTIPTKKGTLYENS